MTHVAAYGGDRGSATSLEQLIRARIDSLSYLPSSAAVAIKFVELGKDLDAGPNEYAMVISADSALSSKILALANSSWFGVRQHVTQISMAVNLLGLGTIRALAISYCMAGLHNELRLTAEESRMFWESSLGKAVAAKQFVSRIDAKLGDEAFAMGLFEDFAIPVMYATAKEQMLAVLENPKTNWKALLQSERDLFRLDHTEIGRMLAQKLELPEVFVDAVAFHHNKENLGNFMEHEALADAVYAASLFPHLLSVWSRQDAEELTRLMENDTQGESTPVDEFLQTVQKEFDQLIRFFVDGESSNMHLVEMMEKATKEVADNTTELVGANQSLMQQAASMGMQMNKLVSEQNKLETKAICDSLTGVLNREGFTTQAEALLAKAVRYGTAIAVVYLDVDKFKQANDTLGHEFGDRALRWVTEQMTAAARPSDLVGRMGGDEFVMLLDDCVLQDAQQIVERVRSAIAAEPVGKGKLKARLTVSAGLLWVKPSADVPLDRLLSAADKLMYQAKRAGGNQVADPSTASPQKEDHPPARKC